jgi:hypothetical protein
VVLFGNVWIRLFGAPLLAQTLHFCLVLLTLRSLRVYPVEGQDLTEFGFACLSLPTARASNLFGRDHRGRFTFHADSLMACRAFQDQVIVFVHAPILTGRRWPRTDPGGHHASTHY